MALVFVSFPSQPESHCSLFSTIDITKFATASLHNTQQCTIMLSLTPAGEQLQTSFSTVHLSDSCQGVVRCEGSA